MSDVTPASVFRSLGDEFSWHARRFAAMYGSEYVDTVHILLAVAEVTPVELHGCDELTPVSISATLQALQIGDATDESVESTPRALTGRAKDLVARAMSFASRTNRDPSLRDIWVALSQESGGLASLALDELGVDRSELYRRISGA